MPTDAVPLTDTGFVLGDKTLIAWVGVADLQQRGGGSVLTLEMPGGIFDAIVFGERAQSRWMAGSDSFQRTETDQEAWPAETADPDELIQIAVIYHGREITICRNGQLYARYTMPSPPVQFGPETTVLFGPRHQDALGSHFLGSIADARIYDHALSVQQVAALQPERLSDPAPLAWWTFADGLGADNQGVFAESALFGSAEIRNGRLQLPEEGSALIAVPTGSERSEQIARLSDSLGDRLLSTRTMGASRQFRLHLLADRHRPTYHFTIPEGNAMPFDPNGCIHWGGRYHLGYIYQDEGVHFWGHASSLDMLHWRHHEPWLYPTPDSPETGIFSGNCFVNKEGEATMLYHGCDAGNCIATSSDPQLDHFDKLGANPIVPSPVEGDAEFGLYRSWDPHGWLEDDTYYAIFGGTRPSIFRADELDKWTHVGDLLAHPVPGVDLDEDISCPDLFELGGQRVLVCISHRMGCRYYVGEWRDEQFHPDTHAQMSWVDNAFFAPESLLDPTGRRIMWAWIFDGREPLARQASGWSGTMSLPRVLTVGDDGLLRMKPIEELVALRYNERHMAETTIEAGAEVTVREVIGDTLELTIRLLPGRSQECGVKVCCSPDGSEQTRVYYDAGDGQLKIDTRQSSQWQGAKSVESGPFRLGSDEELVLSVFVDRSVVEVFANGRQAVMRRIYPSRPDSLGVSLFANGGSARLLGLSAWDMMPSNPY